MELPPAVRAVRSFVSRAAGSWYAFPVALFLATRAVLVGVAAFGLHFVPQLQQPRSPELSLSPTSPFEAFCRWDCNWYAQIARLGFHNTATVNFWPAYPVSAGWLHRLTGLPVDVSLLLLANLACLGAFVVIYRIFERLSSNEAARSGLGLFAAAPGAFFLSAGYTEAYMVFFSALAVLLALDSRHFSSAVMVGLAGLSRVLGFVTLATLGVLQLLERPQPRRFLLNLRLLALAIPFLFLGGYMVWLQQRFGNPLQFLESRKVWGPLASWSLVDVYRRGDSLQASYVVVSILPLAGSVLLLLRRSWWSLAPLALILTVVDYAMGMSSFARYAAVVWPAYLSLGAILAKRPSVQAALVGGCWALQAVYLVLHTHSYPVL